MTLTEDDVRRIVREEIARGLKVLADTATGLDDYHTGELFKAGLEAVAHAAEMSVKVLPHDVECRKRVRWFLDCSCSIGED